MCDKVQILARPSIHSFYRGALLKNCGISMIIDEDLKGDQTEV